jgi:4-amino-4-deoxy-L-arabinose transferase-like glycosyltransferase
VELIGMRLASRLLVLGLVALVFCAPLYRGLRSVDAENDEAIYSYAVDSILETGDWLNPRSSPTPEETFLEKPPLKFWIVALPIRLGLLPDDDFGMRFWDATFGALAFLYIFAFGRRLAGWPCGAAALLTMYTLDRVIFSHGLRGNNMEAAVILAYAGGVYHFLRWVESERTGPARAHAVAVGAYFFLAFMTKFVAAAFLPMIVGAASLELPQARTKLVKEWRTWLAVSAGIVVLAAPWFIYQTMRPGRNVWSIMLAEHVVKRFQSSLDPTHVHPWSFYFEYLGGGLLGSGMIWPVILGAAMIHVRVVRERWLPGTLVLYWFWLPFVLISFGSSKLFHYAYPFLAPVCLAVGYAVGAVSAAVVRIVAVLTDPDRARRFAVPASVARVFVRVRPAWPWIQRALLATGLLWLVLAAIDLLSPGRFRVFGILVRPPAVGTGILVACLLGILAKRATWMARLAVPLMLLSFMPVGEYRSAVQRTTVEEHPLRSTSECIAGVRRDELAAGRKVHAMVVSLPAHTFHHAFFYYYRSFGWDRHDETNDEAVLTMLDDPAEQRPILLPKEKWLAIRAAHDTPGTMRPSVNVYPGIELALPGPYARCTF